MKIINNILLIRAGLPPEKEIDHPVHCPPPLTLKYTKALLAKRGNYNVKIIDCLIKDFSNELILKTTIDWHADLILIDITSSAFEQGLNLCRMIKQHQNIFIVAAGADVSERYEYYLTLNSDFDIILRGEFEQEICTLLERLNATNEIKSVKEYYNNQKIKEVLLVDNLDDLPLLKWDEEELNTYTYRYPLKFFKKITPGYIATSRGCRHGCTFCSPSVRKSYGKRLRLRSPSKVVDEIAYLQELGVNVISFEDDDFTGSKNHVLSVCDEICKRGLDIKWACHARIDEVTPELLKAMSNAGCILILFGIESGSKKIIDILRKAPPSAEWRINAINTFSTARELGIATCALFMVGNPAESPKDVDDSLCLSYELKPDFIKVHNFTLYPGSLDYKRYQNEDDNLSAPHHYLKPIVNVSSMNNYELKNVQLKFYRKFFFRPSFICSHFYRYLLFYLNNYGWSFKMLNEVLCFLLFGNTPKHVKSDKKRDNN